MKLQKPLERYAYEGLLSEKTLSTSKWRVVVAICSYPPLRISLSFHRRTTGIISFYAE